MQNLPELLALHSKAIHILNEIQIQDDRIVFWIKVDNKARCTEAIELKTILMPEYAKVIKSINLIINDPLLG